MALESNTAPIPGSIADRYVVREVLGRGGMATVYRVHDLSTGRELALKRLDAGGNGKDTAKQLFEQEFSALSQLAHPRVVEVYDYIQTASEPFYTIELLEGDALRP